MRDLDGEREQVAEHLRQDDEREHDLGRGVLVGLVELGLLEVEEQRDRLIGHLGVGEAAEEQVGSCFAS